MHIRKRDKPSNGIWTSFESVNESLVFPANMSKINIILVYIRINWKVYSNTSHKLIRRINEGSSWGGEVFRN